jgi:hypothetical protein
MTIKNIIKKLKTLFCCSKAKIIKLKINNDYENNLWIVLKIAKNLSTNDIPVKGAVVAERSRELTIIA